ncbi:MAG: hypothetical protein ACI8RD_009799, partial [Bacillariaceae sp.]
RLKKKTWVCFGSVKIETPLLFERNKNKYINKKGKK